MTLYINLATNEVVADVAQAGYWFNPALELDHILDEELSCFQAGTDYSTEPNALCSHPALRTSPHYLGKTLCPCFYVYAPVELHADEIATVAVAEQGETVRPFPWRRCKPGEEPSEFFMHPSWPIEAQ